MNEKIIDCENLDLESYEEFLKAKLNPFYEVKGRKVILHRDTITASQLNKIETDESHLFDYQRFIVNLATLKKKYAIFADCGLGKTAMFLAWIRRLMPLCQDGKKILIISPLMVLQQTLNEEKKFYKESYIEDIHEKNLDEWLNSNSKLGITNIDKFHKVYDLKDKVLAVVLDESSILKNADGKTRTNLIETFKGVEFKLCCSATPAPNDREEYANHATFLDYVRSNNEFYARFFVNKDNGWIIKPHGFDAFFKYLSEWSVYLRNPDKYSFQNNIQQLPKPIFQVVNIDWTEEQKEYLTQNTLTYNPPFTLEKKLTYLKLSKGFSSIEGKVTQVPTNKLKEIDSILENHKGKKTVIWVVYNEEERIIMKHLKAKGYRAKAISGATAEGDRVKILEDFRMGEFDILVSKSSLVGFGLNMPFVNVHIFNGMTDSYEQFYQSVKRSYRYGATETLYVYITATNAERIILDNVFRKKEEFEADSEKQESFFIKYLQGELDVFFNRPFTKIETKEKEYDKTAKGNGWELINGDSIKVLRELPKESLDLAVFSPPFASLFTYSNDIADMGNSGDGHDEFNLHFEYFLQGLHEAMRKGRMVCCHLSNLATLKSRDGYIGLKDFRGVIIKLFQKSGFTYFGEWAIAKNPQMQAIKEKVRTLSFAQLESDRLGSRSGLNDMILVFKKKGEANTKLSKDRTAPTRDEWIQWACGCWTGIRESDTLRTRGTKSEEDVKHICPMNLTVIERCIRMYSKDGEMVLDPFNGIGSVGVISAKLRRNYLGIELKPEYYKEAIRNLKCAEILRTKPEIPIRDAMKGITEYIQVQPKKESKQQEVKTEPKPIQSKTGLLAFVN